MKRILLLLTIPFLVSGCASVELVLEAAQLPFTAHAVWDAPTDATSQYKLVSDQDAPVVIQATSACSPTQCIVPITVSSFGSHTLTVTAEALAISTDPNSMVDSTPASITWVLNNSANPVKTLKVGK